MQRLLGYPATVYDANCIIYYCFHFEGKRRNGSTYILESNGFTSLTRKITEALVAARKSVKTIRVVMGEVRDQMAVAVKTRVNEMPVRQQLGLDRLERIPPELLLQIAQRCVQRVKKLAAKPWFLVEDFHPHQLSLAALTRFFHQVGRDTALRDRLRPEKNPMPASQDLHLMAYSKDAGLPILTNDSNFTAFLGELRSGAHVTEIVPLTSVRM